MDILREEKLKELEKIANDLRKDVIEMILEAGSGHPAGSLGMADIFSALYFHILRHDPKNPDWQERDRLVLSNGHICPILYASLARAGYFPMKNLKTLRKFGSSLQGHPYRKDLKGIETTSGPLGEGLSQAIGMALAGRMDGKKHQIYCLMSDGEQNEGMVWEAAMCASKFKLSNLTAIIDRNSIQSDGFTEDIMPLDSLKEKYESFNWHVLEVDGHNIEAFIDAVSEARAIYEKPTMIIAHTIPGKGVGFMERDYEWHSHSLKKEEARKALAELSTLAGKIEQS
jgi:transketolase